MDKQRSENIENRFRQAAENFLPPHDEKAWEKMEALLDAESDKKRAFIWWWPLLLLLLLLVGSAGMYYYYGKGSRDKISPVTTSEVSGSIRQDNRDSKNDKNEQTSATPDLKNNQPANKHRNDVQIQQSSHEDGNGPAAIVLFKRPVVPEQGKSAGKTAVFNKRLFQQADRFVYSKGINKKASLPDPIGEKYIGTRNIYQQDAHILMPAGKLPSPEQSKYLFIIKVPDTAGKNINRRSFVTDSIQQAIAEAKENKVKQDLKPARFYVIASTGKNATNLQKFGAKNTGTVYGGEIGYHLNSLWSLQAGFHVGRKIYFAGPSDYKFQDAYWQSVTVLKIDANCLIFDIPLSARFDILHNKKSILFATAGVSSFIMDREDYKYHYNTSSGTYRKSEMKYKGKVDLFSSANLSVGFEQKLFKIISIQVEPYAKLPVSGVGAGKVKLYSLGIQLGLKYQPLKRK